MNNHVGLREAMHRGMLCMGWNAQQAIYESNCDLRITSDWNCFVDKVDNSPGGSVETKLFLHWTHRSVTVSVCVCVEDERTRVGIGDRVGLSDAGDASVV